MPPPDSAAPEPPTPPASETILIHPSAEARWGARPWGLVLGLALVAGLTSWAIGESLRKFFQPPENIVVTMGIPFNRPLFKDVAVATTRNAALVYGTLGGLLGLALGLAGGVVGGSTRSGLAAGFLGLILGAAAGALSSAAGLPLYFHQLEKDQEALSRDLMLPLLMHGIIFAAIGLAGGVAMGVGYGRRRQIAAIAVAGLFGGLVGAGVYELIGALALPNGGTTEPIATTALARLLAALAVSLAMAVLAGLGAAPPAPKPVKAA